MSESMLQQIEIRKIKPAETKLYRELRLFSLKNDSKAFGSTYEEEAGKEVLGFEKHIAEENPENFIVAAFYQNKPISICGFYRQRFIKGRHHGEIIQVFTYPEYRSQGIAKQVMKKTLEFAFDLEGLEQIYLWVGDHNPAAIALYKALGFKMIGSFPRYMKDGDEYTDESAMVLMK